MKKYQYLIERTCPMCNEKIFKKINEEEQQQYDNYVCYGGLIQQKLTLFDKFGREFVKMGYCPDCQEKLFSSKLADKSEYFFEKSIRKDSVNEFIDKAKQNKNTLKEAIQSEIADILNANEKLLYLYETGQDYMFVVDENGKVYCVED